MKKEFDGEKAVFSAGAQNVWEALTLKQKKALSKDNPFRRDRNEVICALRARDVSPDILAEITGLTRQAVWKITAGKLGVKGSELKTVKQHLKDIQRATGRLGHFIGEIEKTK